MAGKVIISRESPGVLLVKTDPDVPQLSERFALPLQEDKRFNKAAGWASHLAARYGLELVDETGRLSAADCAAMVEAVRERESALIPRPPIARGGNPIT